MVIRRLIGALEAPTDLDVVGCIRDVTQAKIIADEFGIKFMPSTATTNQKKLFVADIKAKLTAFVGALARVGGGAPPSPWPRSIPPTRGEGLSSSRPVVVSDDDDGPISSRRGRIDGEVRDIAAIAELTRGVQARVTASHQRLRATLAKLREKSPQLFPEVLADVKGLPVSALMEIDAAFQRQGLKAW